MKLLIVSATHLEIEPLISNFSFIEQKNKNLYSYRYRDFEVDVLIAGIGMVATAFCMGKTLQATCYDVAINAGISGSFDYNLPLGAVLNVTHDRFPEMGAENGEYFLSLVDLQLLEEDSFPFQNLELVNSSIFQSPVLNELPQANGITVNTIHGNEENIHKIREQYNPVSESMEGAAFMYACLLSGIRFIQIRAISNYVEKRNRENWNIGLAIKNLNEVLWKVLDE